MSARAPVSVTVFVLAAAAAPPPSLPAQNALVRPAAAGGPVDFGRDVRPILSNHCFQCHGPDAEQRKRELRLDTLEGTRRELPSGKRAVVPGDAGSSELWRRITSDDANERMPPAATGRALSPGQIATLRAWIDGSAPWTRHWSFVPPAPPAAGGPIDAFLRARLRDAGLAPAREASRERLIRRVTLDLTGLPPAVAEVDAFLKDTAPGAYGRVVDRLLASPRYGEHMARYWLDAARYGDTHGYHLDNYRSLWPYRDWVIRAFDANMPFDRFTVEQLAGDLLPDATNDQKIATGFNRCNITTAEGGLIAEEYLAKYAMDRAETTATVFLGLTMRCARCHDHKFDPISQRDYYSMFAFFNSIAEEASDKNQPIAPPFTTAPSPEQERERKRLEGSIAELTARMDAPLPAADAAQRAWERRERERLDRSWHALEPRSALSRGGATMRVQPDHSVLAAGVSPARDVYEIVAATTLHAIQAVRLEALPSDEQPGQGIGRASHGNIVLTGFEVQAKPFASPQRETAVRLTTAAADYSQRDYDVDAAIDTDPKTGWAIDKERGPLAAVFAPDEPIGPGGGCWLRFRLRFESVHPQHTIRRFRLAVSTDPAMRPATLGTWSTLGPFPAKSFGAAHDTDFGPERAAGAPSAAGGKTWRERPDLTDGKIHRLPGPIGAVYLHRTITAPSTRPIVLALGSDDGIKVWLNGELLLDRSVRRGCAPDQDKVTAQLSTGENRLLLKVTNAGGAQAFYFRVAGESAQGLPSDVVWALQSKARGATESRRIRAHYRRRYSTRWQALDRERVARRAALAKLRAAIPRTMIMQERTEPRPAHVLVRGRYDLEGERVEPGTPAALPPLGATGRATRLDLARWLVHPDHPLTARVAVNRLWQQVFGTGIVKTAEDFGAQGEWPSHPELLDWLARDFVASGWDVKRLMKQLVMSAAYRQSSRVRPEHLAKDPDNRLLARGPRFRLDAETIRDQALFAGGLLVEKLGGPSVKPYQPPGVWKAIGYTSSNTANFRRDTGDKLYRRSLYTFWKRTAPPPAMVLFDAPSREECRVRRERTNTPLQALALLNDVQHVECARGLATRVLRDGGGGDGARLTWAFRTVTSRRPDPPELASLKSLLDAQRAYFRSTTGAALQLVQVGESKPDPNLDTVALAAWTTVANVLLNLDETLTKG